MDEDLKALRARIDGIDDAILKLVSERAGIAQQVPRAHARLLDIPARSSSRHRPVVAVSVDTFNIDAGVQVDHDAVDQIARGPRSRVAAKFLRSDRA